MSDRIALRATIAFVCLSLAILAGAYGRARGLAADGAPPSLPPVADLRLRGTLE